MQFKSSIPYPKVRVSKKDINLAKNLLYSYAGFISEDTAVHNYFFQSMMIDDEEIKKILKEIAIVEMHHLEILGNLIYELGLTPKFISDNIWFTGEYIDYEKDFKKVLNSNIKSEELAIANYELIINETDDIYVEHILKRIILDEKIHIEIFKKLLKYYE